MASAFKRAQQIHRSRTRLNCCQTEKETYFEFWIRKVLEKSWWTCGISTDMRSATWDLCWPLQGWEHRFEIWPVCRLTFLFEGTESVWANFSRKWKRMSKLFKYSNYNFFSPEFGTDACLGRWYGSCAPGRHDKTFAFYNRGKNFFELCTNRLKEVMIQRATILGEYSPLQETGRNTNLTSIWETVKYYRKKSMNQQNKGDGQIFFCEWRCGEVTANSVTYL